MPTVHAAEHDQRRELRASQRRRDPARRSCVVYAPALSALARASAAARAPARASVVALITAPIAAKPAPTRKARWKPWVSATSRETVPATSAVCCVAIVASSARPMEPPTWRKVLTSPDASPASGPRMPDVAAIVTETNAQPRPAAVTIDGPSTWTA